MALRTKIPDFELANPLYVGATVSFFSVDVNGQSTGQLATLYAAPTGQITALNPQTLDSDGKLAAPVYIEDPVIAEVVGANVESHTTGVISPLRGTWRGDWVTGTVYRANDFVRDPALDDIYVATRDYTSRATIAADISAGDLLLVFSFSEVNADANALQNAVNTATSAATSASNSATSASNSATSASNSATSASNSATSASNSATSAASSAASAAASAAVVGTRAPQGRLTPINGKPIIDVDAVSVTTIYYTPHVGNNLPLWNGSNFELRTFTELALGLVADHAANTIYDVFAFLDGSTLRIGTGPAWANSGSGSGSRGSGSGTTELERVDGLFVNKVNLTARNGSNTYAVDARKGTYLGSLFIDGTAGQITCHQLAGQNRKWGVWNAYHRVPTLLRMSTTGDWTYNVTITIRAANNDSNNALTVFAGLSEELANIRITQMIRLVSGGGPTSARAGIGWNSISAASGVYPRLRITTSNSLDATVVATSKHYFLGIVRVTLLEEVPENNSSVLYFGGEGGGVMEAEWCA